VQTGETLSSIARRYGTTWQAIAQANGLVNPNQIYRGQKLKISASSGGTGGTGGTTTGCRLRHTVKRGEWVWQIARNYGVSPYDILAANGLTIQSANVIYAGRVLCIP
jgi:lysozyme